MTGRISKLIVLLWLGVVATALAPVRAQETGADKAAPAVEKSQSADKPAPAAEKTATVSAAEGKLDAADARLADLQNRIEKNAGDDVALADLKVAAETLARSMLEVGVSLRPRLTEVKARLDLLGSPPAEGAPPEPEATAAERNGLAQERAFLNMLTGRAESIAIKAGELGDRVTELRRALFTQTLLKRVTIDGSFFEEARKALRAELSDFLRITGSWISFVLSFKLQPLLASVFFSLVAALFFIAGGYRLFGNLMYRDPADPDPPYTRRLSAALWSAVIPTVALAALFISVLVLMTNFAVLRGDIAPMLAAVFVAIVLVSFVTTVARVIFAPHMPNWRLMALSNRGASTLYYLVVLMTVVNAVDYVIASITASLGSPVVLTAAESFIAAILIGLILIVMSRVRPMLAESGDPSEPGRPWPRVIANGLALAGLGLIALTITGYIGMSRFAATQIVLTGAIVATMYIGFLSGQGVSSPGMFAETALGRFVEKRYSPKAGRMDQFGVVAGLAIQFAVLLIGVPLILLQWGFQIQDIQLWLYRAFTDIQIGGISISLSGILIGLGLFAAGLFATRRFQRWLDANVMARGRMDPGVRNSIRTGIGYLGVAVAGLIGVLAAGIDLSSLALIAGALSLGIGFGLQNIVSNFVSGLILLAERPFKVGDWIVTGSAEGFVKKISVRATEIETFQRQSIIVPNSELINASVGNWTHRNAIGRADIAIGVSYDSDPRKVMQILEEIVLAHELVLRNPEPAIHFVNFGASSLDFEIKVFLADVLTGMRVKNELRIAIFERLKAEGIEIPFPQTDVHLKLGEGMAAHPAGSGPIAEPVSDYLERASAETAKSSQPKKRRRRSRALVVPDEDGDDS